MLRLSQFLVLLSIGIFSTSGFADREPMVITVQGGGKVSSQPAGIACPDDCFENYKDKMTITLTATAEPGSKFSGWSGACAGTDPVCVTKMKKARYITAIFSNE